MGNLLQRAWMYANLTPGERAILRFAETLLVGAVLAGVQAIFPLLSSQSLAAINWSSVLHTFVATFVVALYLGVSKYLKAHGDPNGPTLWRADEGTQASTKRREGAVR